MRKRGLLRRWAAAGLAAVAAAALGSSPLPSAAVSWIDWPTYLYDAGHTSTSPAAAITTANTASLVRAWRFISPGPTVPGQPNGGFVASPTVYHGVVYIGSNTGVFYALDETTGAVRWTQMVGYVTKKTCAARGVAATAAVATDPQSGRPTVYVAGGDGYLYALDAATGSITWRSVIAIPSTTVNDYFDWSSPAVANGRVYVGVSSQCDHPLVPRSGVRAYDQVTGQQVAEWDSMNPGYIGGSVWSSVAVDASGQVFATTGNGTRNGIGNPAAIVRLDGTSLALLDAWKIPSSSQVEDNDFDASPNIFRATLNGVPTEMVGACNKNGSYYAFRANSLGAGPAWTFNVGVGTGAGEESCLAAAIFDGSYLFLGGNATMIGGVAYDGSVRKLDPATGAVVWETGLPAIILGSPALDAGGVVAASTYSGTVQNGTYLLNAGTGAVLRFITHGKEFSQPVFADTYMLLAMQGGILTSYKPK